MSRPFQSRDSPPEWVQIERLMAPSEVIIFGGQALSFATSGFFRPLLHRVKQHYSSPPRLVDAVARSSSAPPPPPPPPPPLEQQAPPQQQQQQQQQQAGRVLPGSISDDCHRFSMPFFLRPHGHALMNSVRTAVDDQGRAGHAGGAPPPTAASSAGDRQYSFQQQFEQHMAQSGSRACSASRAAAGMPDVDDGQAAATMRKRRDFSYNDLMQQLRETRTRSYLFSWLPKKLQPFRRN